MGLICFINKARGNIALYALFIFGFRICFVPKRFKALKKNCTYILEFYFSAKLFWFAISPPIQMRRKWKKRLALAWLYQGQTRKVISKGLQRLFSGWDCSCPLRWKTVTNNARKTKNNFLQLLGPLWIYDEDNLQLHASLHS